MAMGYVTYIGFVVAMGIGTSAWNTPIMPAYFVSGAMTSGIALMTMVGIIRHRLLSSLWEPETAKRDTEIVIKLARFAALFLLINLFFIFSQQVHMRFGSEWSVLAAQAPAVGQDGHELRPVYAGAGDGPPARRAGGAEIKPEHWRAVRYHVLRGAGYPRDEILHHHGQPIPADNVEESRTCQK